MKHIKLFEGFLNEETTSTEWKEICDFVKKEHSWFDIEEEDDDEILLTTRENGNTGDETPGDKDKTEARRIYKLVTDKFPKKVKGSLEDVDEFVYLHIKRAKA